MRSKDIKLYEAKGDLSKPWFLYWREGGRRKRAYKGINTYQTAVERRAAAMELKRKLLSKPNAETRAAFKQIMDWIKAREHLLRTSTISAYRNKTKMFFGWLGRRPLDRDSVREFFEYLLAERQIGKGTFNAYITQLRYLIREALQYKEDLFDSIKRHSKQSIPAVFFSKLQIKELSTELKNMPELWLAVQFIFYCFIRPGELRLLKVSDIDFEREQILIRREIAKNKKEQWVTIPKVFLNAVRHLGDYPPNYYVIGKENKPIGKNRLKQQHQALLKKMGYDTTRYKLYSWKHTGAVMAVLSGIHLKQLQIQIRHHSLDELNGYLRQMGVLELNDLQNNFPSID
jgi:integrase